MERNLQRGDATEHTHRPALKALLESLAQGVTATNEPKRVACGAPDFIVTRRSTPLGYVETKDVGKSLDAIEADARRAKPKTHDGQQLQRYLESLGNLLLTNYLEFRWYVRGQHRLSACPAKAAAKGKLRKQKEGLEPLLALLQAFLRAEVPTVASSKELAERMAALARLTREAISRAFEDESGGGSLHQQMEGFRKVLLHDLTREQFADMYAQTIAYGLFTARCHHRGKEAFSRKHAPYDLPKTNPFLRKAFAYVAGVELDERVVWVVDDLAELLRRSDMEAILKDFGRRTRREDPVVHFYETFLAAYDPKMREARGVYYTPEPVVSYIVRSIDQILKSDFGLKDGLADTTTIPLYRTLKTRDGKTKREKAGECHKVLILDPACGTGTFLYGVIDHIHEHEVGRGRAGAWSGYVSRHLLPRLFGFELLMAPYAVAHMKLGLQLAETGYDFQADERLRIYLTNTLEEAHELSGLPLFAQWLAEEANAAGGVKQEAPVMVILGNPPYSGHSANVGRWIVDLLHGKDTMTGKATGNYFEVDGKPLGEKNPKWLNDDYVKFIRFAQWRIEQTGYGILGFITNHGYLDNPTFRGMRQSLMETFDDIYVLDLHGNTKKKEVAPDGSKDDNVFDIQ
ncbi:MAG TPA: DNA methyltransferase, partial [Candidatus Hydrogenedentes bacterium]|nr:DNA methyltransferase [Candidatus Hydrogenedentota bacterium]